MICEGAHSAKWTRKTSHGLKLFYVWKNLQIKKKHKIGEIFGDMLKKKRTK
jgi:hypothetical protein